MRTCSLSKGILLCLAILLVGLNLTCRDKTPQPADSNQPEPNTPSEPNANAPVAMDVNAPVQTAGEKVAVTVNGVKITEKDILELIGSQLAKIDQQAGKLPPLVAEQYKKQLREQAIEQLIRRELLDEKIKDANIVVTEEEVMNQLNEIASDQKMSLEDFKSRMEQLGQSFEQIKEEVRKSLARNKFMEAQWAGKINVTEEEAKKYYNENQKQFNVPEQIRVSHILLHYGPYLQKHPNADPNEVKAKVKAKAQELLQQIKDGADFAELAKANSDCPSAPKGGDLGYISKGDTTPEFEKAAFELKVGQVSDVVETEYGCHIIKVTDHKDARVIPFEQAKEEIIKQLTEEKQTQFAQKYIDSLKTQAKITYPPKLPPSP